jgi:hypothetical protein
LIPWNTSNCGAFAYRSARVRDFALDDLPEKWKRDTELNESYVKAGKFTPEKFAKQQDT